LISSYVEEDKMLRKKFVRAFRAAFIYYFTLFSIFAPILQASVCLDIEGLQPEAINKHQKGFYKQLVKNEEGSYEISLSPNLWKNKETLSSTPLFLFDQHTSDLLGFLSVVPESTKKGAKEWLVFKTASSAPLKKVSFTLKAFQNAKGSFFTFGSFAFQGERLNIIGEGGFKNKTYFDLKSFNYLPDHKSQSIHFLGKTALKAEKVKIMGDIIAQDHLAFRVKKDLKTRRQITSLKNFLVVGHDNQPVKRILNEGGLSALRHLMIYADTYGSQSNPNSGSLRAGLKLQGLFLSNFYSTGILDSGLFLNLHAKRDIHLSSSSRLRAVTALLNAQNINIGFQGEYFCERSLCCDAQKSININGQNLLIQERALGSLAYLKSHAFWAKLIANQGKQAQDVFSEHFSQSHLKIRREIKKIPLGIHFSAPRQKMHLRDFKVNSGNITMVSRQLHLDSALNHRAAYAPGGYVHLLAGESLSVLKEISSTGYLMMKVDAATDLTLRKAIQADSAVFRTLGALNLENTVSIQGLVEFVAKKIQQNSDVTASKQIYLADKIAFTPGSHTHAEKLEIRAQDLSFNGSHQLLQASLLTQGKIDWRAAKETDIQTLDLLAHELNIHVPFDLPNGVVCAQEGRMLGEGFNIGKESLAVFGSVTSHTPDFKIDGFFKAQNFNQLGPFNMRGGGKLELYNGHFCKDVIIDFNHIHAHKIYWSGSTWQSKVKHFSADTLSLHGARLLMNGTHLLENFRTSGTSSTFQGQFRGRYWFSEGELKIYGGVKYDSMVHQGPLINYATLDLQSLRHSRGALVNFGRMSANEAYLSGTDFDNKGSIHVGRSHLNYDSYTDFGTYSGYRVYLNINDCLMSSSRLQYLSSVLRYSQLDISTSQPAFLLGGVTLHQTLTLKAPCITVGTIHDKNHEQKSFFNSPYGVNFITTHGPLSLNNIRFHGDFLTGSSASSLFVNHSSLSVGRNLWLQSSSDLFMHHVQTSSAQGTKFIAGREIYDLPYIAKKESHDSYKMGRKKINIRRREMLTQGNTHVSKGDIVFYSGKGSTLMASNLESQKNITLFSEDFLKLNEGRSYKLVETFTTKRNFFGTKKTSEREEAVLPVPVYLKAADKILTTSHEIVSYGTHFQAKNGGTISAQRVNLLAAQADFRYQSEMIREDAWYSEFSSTLSTKIVPHLTKFESAEHSFFYILSPIICYDATSNKPSASFLAPDYALLKKKIVNGRRDYQSTYQGSLGIASMVGISLLTGQIFGSFGIESYFLDTLKMPSHLATVASAGVESASSALVFGLVDKGDILKYFSLESIMKDALTAGIRHNVLGKLGFNPHKSLSISDKESSLKEKLFYYSALHGSSFAVHQILSHDETQTPLDLIAQITASATGHYFANKISLARSANQIGFLSHKLLHSTLGAVMGALINHREPGRGMVSGALSGAISETIADVMTPSLFARTFDLDREIQEQTKKIGRPLSEGEKYQIHLKREAKLKDRVQLISRLGTTVLASFLKYDLKIADAIAQNALENNWIHFVIMGGFSAWGIYDAWSVYKNELSASHNHEHAILATMKHLEYEITIGVVGGKVISQGTKIAAPSIKAAWQHVMSKNPSLKLFMQKMGIKVAFATEVVSSKIGRINQATDAFVTRHWTKATGRATTGKAAGAAEGTAINQRPYHPRAMEAHLESQYPGEVKAHTLAGKSAPNAKLANTIHPETGVPFDSRGFPIFDKHVVYETRISGNLAVESSATHMRKATKQLKHALEQNPALKSQFNEQQLRDIFSAKPKIDGLTWHHHQERGRMQLIPFDIHKITKHPGGMSLWGK